jgi:hypothetical protein
MPCFDLDTPRVMGIAEAGPDGLAEFSLDVPADLPDGRELSVQAVVFGLGVSFEAESNRVDTLVSAAGACGDDICGDDEDGDGIVDSCDVCPDGPDGPDADDDGVPDACDWAGRDAFCPGDAVTRYPTRETSPPATLADCIGEPATLEREVSVLMSGAIVDEATLTAPADGWYDVYDFPPSDSGDSQRNESAMVRIFNASNPGGWPLNPNCGDEYILVDADNEDLVPERVLLGTFWLLEGENTLQLTHYCDAWDACPTFHDDLDPASTCASDGINSVHLSGDGLCVVSISD